MIGGMKPSSSERSPCTGSPCIGSAATILTASPKVSFRRRPLPISVPPVPRPATKADTSSSSSRISSGGAVVVGGRVGRVAVLVGHVARGVVGGHLERHRDRAVGALGAVGVDDLRAVHLQQLGALGRHVLGHHDLQPVALARADHRQRDAGVAGGRFEDRLPGPIAPFSSASSISARATRSFTEPVGLRDSSFAQMRTPGFGDRSRQLDQRRVADRLDDVAVATPAGPVPEPLRRHYFTEYSGVLRRWCISLGYADCVASPQRRKGT